MSIDLTEILAIEEAKTGRTWSPAERWRVIQATITWAEAQATVRRNTPEACHKKEAILQAQIQKAVKEE